MNARIPDDALPPALDPDALQAFVDDKWDNEIIPALTDYIAIPAKSPAFDADWEKNAFIERWCAMRRNGSRARRCPA